MTNVFKIYLKICYNVFKKDFISEKSRNTVSFNSFPKVYLISHTDTPNCHSLFLDLLSQTEYRLQINDLLLSFLFARHLSISEQVERCFKECGERL